MNPIEEKKKSTEKLGADWKSLMRTFIRPEDEAMRSILLKYMEQILFGLHDFLKEHVGITQEISLKSLAEDYTDSQIRATPEKKLDAVIFLMTGGAKMPAFA